jgi:ABC-2 type transport system permease protein
MLAQLRTSLTTAMQYRADFVLQGVLSVMWMGAALVPLLVIFERRQTMAGWTWPQALVVIGWFTAVKAVLEGAVSPSLTAVVEHVRKGTLDFVLLKPADAQFLVSTAKFEPWKVVDLLGSLGIITYALRETGRWPSPVDVGAAVLMLVVAVLVLYSLWILVVSLSFYVVRVDNLSFLFTTIFDAGRWPIQVFKGAVRFVFTYIFPLALMTTYPAMALLGTLEPVTALYALLGGVAFAAVARLVWLRALGNYTSASS